MSIHRRFPSDFFIGRRLRAPALLPSNKIRRLPQRRPVRVQTEDPPSLKETPRFGTPIPNRVKNPLRELSRGILRVKHIRPS